MASTRGSGTILSGTACTWLGQLTAHVATAALFLVAARLVDPAEFGRTAICYGVAAAGSHLLDLGATARLLRDAATDSVSPDRLRSLIFGKPVLALAVSPVPVLLFGAVIGSPVAALAAWLYAILRAEILLAQALWQVDGRPGRGAAVAASDRLIMAPVGTMLLLTGFAAPTAVAAGLLVGASVATVPAVRRLARSAARPRADTPRRPLDYRSAWSVLRFGGHYAPMSVASNLLLLDTALVGAVAGDAQAGAYGLGARLLGPFLMATAALSTALVPVAARRSGPVRRPFVLITGATLVGLGVVVATAPQLVLVAVGPDHLGAVPAVRAFAVAAGAVALAQPVAAWLQARGDDRWVSRVVTLGTVLALAGAAVGAAVGGATGAAAGQTLVIGVVAASLIRRACAHRRPLRATRGRQPAGGAELGVKT